MFAPPTPNELTPARRSPPGGRSQRVISRTTAMRPPAKSIFGLGAATLSDAGITPSRTASVALTSPGTPAAAFRWPMFDFTDPMRSGASRGAPCASLANASAQALASTTSPSAVPVP